MLFRKTICGENEHSHESHKLVSVGATPTPATNNPALWVRVPPHLKRWGSLGGKAPDSLLLRPGTGAGKLMAVHVAPGQWPDFVTLPPGFCVRVRRMAVPELPRRLRVEPETPGSGDNLWGSLTEESTRRRGGVSQGAPPILTVGQTTIGRRLFGVVGVPAALSIRPPPSNRVAVCQSPLWRV